MKMKPAGAENAFTVGVSITAKCHSRVGRALYAATVLPTSVTYCCSLSSFASGYVASTRAETTRPMSASSPSVNSRFAARATSTVFLTLLGSIRLRMSPNCAWAAVAHAISRIEIDCVRITDPPGSCRSCRPSEIPSAPWRAFLSTPHRDSRSSRLRCSRRRHSASTLLSQPHARPRSPRRTCRSVRGDRRRDERDGRTRFSSGARRSSRRRHSMLSAMPG